MRPPHKISSWHRVSPIHRMIVTPSRRFVPIRLGYSNGVHKLIKIKCQSCHRPTSSFYMFINNTFLFIQYLEVEYPFFYVRPKTRQRLFDTLKSVPTLWEPRTNGGFLESQTWVTNKPRKKSRFEEGYLPCIKETSKRKWNEGNTSIRSLKLSSPQTFPCPRKTQQNYCSPGMT